jgi:anti-sigma-K factor RskA
MPDHVIPHPDLAGYVLDALEPDERAEFEAHLPGCEVCQAEVEELEGLPTLLDQAAPPVEVPADLKQRTFAAVDQAAAAAAADRRKRRRWRLVGVPAAALLIVLAAFVGYTLSPSGLIGGRHRVIELTLAAPNGGPGQATAKIREVNGRLAIDMTVSGLAPNPPGSLYECWFVGPGDTLERPNRISAGTFTVGADGRASLRLTSAADLARFPTMGVTLERDGGNPRRTGDKVLISRPAP